MGGLTDLTPGSLPKDVNKRVVSFGKGRTLSDAPSETKVKFHFRSTKTADPEKVIDDSRKMKNPVELVFGKKFKLEIWEAMLKTMVDKEVAEFQVPKQLLYGYPSVSKTLRDADSNIQSNGHQCCGMLLTSCGYHDLDHLMSKPENLTFTFEVVNVEIPGEYEQESWMLTLKEKEDSIPILRESGNKKYKAGKIAEAKADYFLALSRIEQLSLSEKPGSEEFESLQDKRAPLLLNYGLCLMKEGTYYEAIEHLSSAIQINPANAKAHYRLAKCHQTLGNFNEALDSYAKANQFDPSLEAAVIQETKNISNQKKEQDKTDRSIYNKMFR